MSVSQMSSLCVVRVCPKMGLPEAGWDTVPKPTQKFMNIAESVEAETLQQPKKKDRVGKKKAAVVVVECEVDEAVESDHDSLYISEQFPARSQTRRGRGIQRLAKYDISISKSFIFILTTPQEIKV